MAEQSVDMQAELQKSGASSAVLHHRPFYAGGRS